MNDIIEKNKDYYNKKFGEESDTSLNTEELMRWKIINFKLLTLDIGQHANILDFGCGRGWLSAKLATYGQVTGVDLSPKSIKFATKNYGDKCRFINLDSTSDNIFEYLEENSFDLIVSSEVIEHIVEQKKYFEHIGKLLKKDNGILLLTTPNGSLKDVYFSKGRKNWGQPLENWLTSEQLLSYTKNIFTTIEIKTFNSAWLFNMYTKYSKTLSNRYLIYFIRKMYLLKMYERWLNKRNLGLYLMMIAKR